MQSSGTVVLGDLIRPELVNLNLAGKDRDSVLRELVDQVPSIKSHPETREKLLRALREREQLHSTGIGDGVALPHARNALVGLVDKSLIVFGRHAEGVPYAAVDGKPANLFFLIVAPTVTQHLAILARISRVLHDPKLRQNLLAAQQPQRVVDFIREAEEKMYS